LGRDLVDQIRCQDDFNLISEQIGQTSEFKTILSEGISFPGNDYIDMIPSLRTLRTDGSFIEPEELLDLRVSLITITECLRFFKIKGQERFPRLSSLAADIRIDAGIVKRIDEIIDEKGHIHDHASPLLKKIRADILSRQHAIDKKIQMILQKAKKEGWISDDISVTIRSGRSVIPMPVTHKRKIQGFIHDESSSGQTVYLEPTEIFDINNEIRELENAERREIIRILMVFTGYIRPQLDEMIAAYYFLGTLDFIRAKAQFAIMIRAEKPHLNPSPVIRWQNAIHPLLFLSHQRMNKEVVPLSVDINKEERILIISGPNAGGKSICLKTIGLLQYMLQAGLLVPMSDFSEAGIFSMIFIDIGDEQSIENDLSTYSSHLLNIKFLLENADEGTLFLIDEFGTGTEPQLGGAVAEASLESLVGKNSLGVVTTHYANLKLLAGHLPGIVNGAMLFDQVRMQPLYRLKTGRPGSSYAFEIARKIGFPEEVLETAADKTGKTQLDFEQQLQQLELEKEEIAKKQTEFRLADELLHEVHTKYQRLQGDLEKERAAILAKARDQAWQILNDSNRLIEQTIKEIRESQANREVTKEARDKIRELGKRLAEEGELTVGSGQLAKDRREGKKEKGTENEVGMEKANDQWRPVTGVLKAGDTVRIKGQQTPGEVMEVKGNEALIAFGTMKVKVAADRLEILGKKLQELIGLRPSRSFNSITNEINSRMANFKLTIDVRGKRAEEALGEVRKYIDEALLLNIAEVNIVHGKGDGILLQVIRDFLKTLPEVKHYADEHLERGGNGVTVVRFR
jgi:DNA mismatch repair protein MutS2